MFVTNFQHISRKHISKSKRCFNAKSSTYYLHMETGILTDFQICISVPLTSGTLTKKKNHALKTSKSKDRGQDMEWVKQQKRSNNYF